MPRANRYAMDGQIFHVTHRCHDRQFLLGTQTCRFEYVERLRLLLPGSKTSLLAFCVTGNHVHLLLHSRATEHVSSLMQRAQGEFAQAYNFKKKRSGACWTDRFHATMVQEDEHLWRCMRYIDLNMVRAAAVRHPRDWKWCGYHELTGARKRYRLLDLDWLLAWSGEADVPAFQRRYAEWVDDGIRAGDGLSRQEMWTEAIAVGSREFVEQFQNAYPERAELHMGQFGSDTWAVSDNSMPYTAF